VLYDIFGDERLRVPEPSESKRARQRLTALLLRKADDFFNRLSHEVREFFSRHFGACPVKSYGKIAHTPGWSATRKLRQEIARVRVAGDSLRTSRVVKLSQDVRTAKTHPSSVARNRLGYSLCDFGSSGGATRTHPT